MGGKIIPRIRLTSAKDLVEVEAELGNELCHTQEIKQNLPPPPSKTNLYTPDLRAILRCCMTKYKYHNRMSK